MDSAAPPLPAAVARIAVAQICRSVGYGAADTAALRVLADVAARFLNAVGHAAASAANARGRTETNLLDLAAAIEVISLPHGFSGAAQPGARLLRSWAGPLKGIMDFVASVDEIPFATPIRRWRRGSDVPIPSPTFAQSGVDPPAPHVPRWLPKFPDGWDCRHDRRARKRMELGWRVENKPVVTASPPAAAGSTARRPLSVDRVSVKFVITRKGSERQRCLGREKEVEEDDVSPSRMPPVSNNARSEPLPCREAFRYTSISQHYARKRKRAGP